MARKTKQDKANLIHQLFLKLNGQNRQSWERVNQEGHDFYLDNQLKAVEKKGLEEQGMPTFTINRIIPIVEMLTFYATANDPRWQAVGAEGSDSDAASVHSDIADYIWYISDGKQIYNQVIKDACTKSIGYLQIYIDPNDDRGMGEVKIRNLEPFDIYTDPQSRDPLFRDSSYVMVHKICPRNYLLQLYPEHKTKINKANSQYPNHQSWSEKADAGDFQYKDISENFTILGEDELLVDYYELYEKVKVPYMNVYYQTQPTDEQMKAINKQIEEEMYGMVKEAEIGILEQEKAIKEAVDSGQMLPERGKWELEKQRLEIEGKIEQAKEKKLQDAMAEVSKVENVVVTEKEYNILIQGELKNNLIEAIKFYENKIQLSVVVGDQLLVESILPGTDYPIVPFHYNYTGTPYPMSAVAPLIGKQKELNKAHQLMIHNASLGSSLRWIYVDGSIDTDYWEKYSAAPGALLPVNNGYEIPKEVQPAPLSSAFANIVQEGKGDMEYLAGMYSSQQGDMNTQHDTYKGLLANDEYGTRRVKAWIEGSIKQSLKQVGLLTRDYAQFAYKAEKTFRIVQPSAIQEDREVTINIPMYNDMGVAIGKFNDYATAKFDIRVISGQSLPVNRWAYLGELKELMQLGVVDDIAVLAETDVQNKEKIAERKSLYSQLQGQVQQLEEENKNDKGTIETLQRQLVQAGIKQKVNMAEVEMRKKIVDTGAKVKGDAAVNKANIDLFNKEMKLIKKNYEKQLNDAPPNGALPSQPQNNQEESDKSVANENKQQ
jgi:hypothetical protein